MPSLALFHADLRQVGCTFCRNFIVPMDLEFFMPPEKIPQALKVLDVDGDGKISLSDMRDAVIQVCWSLVSHMRNFAASLTHIDYAGTRTHSPTRTHSLTPSLTHSLTQSLTHSLTHARTHTDMHAYMHGVTAAVQLGGCLIVMAKSMLSHHVSPRLGKEGTAAFHAS